MAAEDSKRQRRRPRVDPVTDGLDPLFESEARPQVDLARHVARRACTAAGVPAFSPHDLRHRRVSLLHLGGMPWARIGELVGHDDLVTTARTYTHVVVDERELDYAELLV